MTTPSTEKRTKTLHVRMTATEYAAYEAGAAGHKKSLSEFARVAMDKQIASLPAKRREVFEQDLADGMIQELGRFRNDYGEPFVLYTVGSPVVFITGSELGWKQGYMYRSGVLADFFRLGDKERQQINKILSQALVKESS